MKTIIKTFIALVILSATNSAVAKNDVYSMLGTWKWEDFTIKVDKCDKTGVCATVISGPNNVGMQMIQTKLSPLVESFVGKIAHPQTGDIYNSQLSMSSSNTWHIDGCTDNNVCASGDFSRVK